jgi:hypothetical protein
MISITPRKPTRIAASRRQPTASPRNTAPGQRHRQRQHLQDRRGIGERHVEERGDEEIRRADFGGGAQRDEPPVAPRQIEPQRPSRRAQTSSRSVVTTPRSVSAWNSGNSSDSAFMKTSFRVNDAMDTIIRLAPRALSDRGGKGRIPPPAALAMRPAAGQRNRRVASGQPWPPGAASRCL